MKPLKQYPKEATNKTTFFSKFKPDLVEASIVQVLHDNNMKYKVDIQKYKINLIHQYADKGENDEIIEYDVKIQIKLYQVDDQIAIELQMIEGE